MVLRQLARLKQLPLLTTPMAAVPLLQLELCGQNAILGWLAVVLTGGVWYWPIAVCISGQETELPVGAVWLGQYNTKEPPLKL